MVMSDSLLYSFAVLCSLVAYAATQSRFYEINTPREGFPDVEVDRTGRVYVALGRRLLRLESDFSLGQSITLSADASNISLTTGEDRLVVCTQDASCAVRSPGDLGSVSSVHPSVVGDGVNGSIALFTTGDAFYVGSFDPTGGASGTINLNHIGGLGGSGGFMRSSDYDVSNLPFYRDFVSGFVRGSYAYYVAFDSESIDGRGIRIMRVCHGNQCPGASSSCGFSALYEETIGCGGSIGIDDGICGVSVVEDFAGVTGTSIVISRCRPGSMFSNVVCLVSLAEVDRDMDLRYNRCSTEPSLMSDLVWSTPISCANIQVRLDIIV